MSSWTSENGFVRTAALFRSGRATKPVHGFEIGRRVGGGVWVISKVALAMHLDGDAAALKAYLSGDRSSQAVKAYFERCEKRETLA